MVVCISLYKSGMEYISTVGPRLTEAQSGGVY